MGFALMKIIFGEFEYAHFIFKELAYGVQRVMIGIAAFVSRNPDLVDVLRGNRRFDFLSHLRQFAP